MDVRRAALAVVVSLTLLPAGAAPASAAPGASVGMRRFAYSPDRVEIRAGQIVEWTYNEDPLDPHPNCESPYFQVPGSPARCGGHSVTSWARDRSGRPLFDSGLHRAERFPYRVALTVPGVFRYYCTIHGGPDSSSPLTDMEGVVVAQPSVRGAVGDRDDVAGQLDVRGLSARRPANGGLTVTVTTWQTWATSALSEGRPYSVRVLFDVDTDGVIGDEDLIVRVVYARGRLVARVSGVDGASTRQATRVGSTGVRFTLPATSAAADPDSDHQLAVGTRAVRAVDRAPQYPGWLPVVAGA